MPEASTTRRSHQAAVRTPPGKQNAPRFYNRALPSFYESHGTCKTMPK